MLILELLWRLIVSSALFVFRCVVGVLFLYLVNPGDSHAPPLIAFAFLAIVCTRGLAAIVVVPVIYLIGFLLTGWLIPAGGRVRKGRLPQKTVESAGAKLPRNRALAEFVRQAAGQGQSWPEIRLQLLASGWAETEMEMAQGLFDDRPV